MHVGAFVILDRTNLTKPAVQNDAIDRINAITGVA